jgi:hypothetical protein
MLQARPPIPHEGAHHRAGPAVLLGHYIAGEQRPFLTSGVGPAVHQAASRLPATKKALIGGALGCLMGSRYFGNVPNRMPAGRLKMGSVGRRAFPGGPHVRVAARQEGPSSGQCHGLSCRNGTDFLKIKKAPIARRLSYWPVPLSLHSVGDRYRIAEPSFA